MHPTRIRRRKMYDKPYADLIAARVTDGTLKSGVLTRTPNLPMTTPMNREVSLRDEPPRRPSQHPQKRPSRRPSSPPRAMSDDSQRHSFMAMHRVVHQEDLSVVFQPIVDVHTGALFATEALVRCRIPELADPMVLFRNAVSGKWTGRLGRMIREIAMPLCAGSPIFVNVHPNEPKRSLAGTPRRSHLRARRRSFSGDHRIRAVHTFSALLRCTA